MKKGQTWESEQAGDAVVVKGTDEELENFRKKFSQLLNVDIQDFLNIEFVENNTKDFVATKRALAYLKNCLEIPPDSCEDPALYPEFHHELVGKDYEMPSIDAFTLLPLQIPAFYASFLIDIFCPNLDSRETCSLEKEFMKQKKVYQLLLIAPLPACFEYKSETQSCTITFADISIASAQLIHDQVKFSLGIFAAKTLCAYFQKVDFSKFQLNKVKSLREKLGHAVIKTQNMEVNEASGNFVLYVLPNQFGPGPRAKIQAVLDSEFKKLQLFTCKRCQQTFSFAKKEVCLIKNLAEEAEDMEFPSHESAGVTESQVQFWVQ